MTEKYFRKIYDSIQESNDRITTNIWECSSDLNFRICFKNGITYYIELDKHTDFVSFTIWFAFAPHKNKTYLEVKHPTKFLIEIDNIINKYHKK
jgi:hypothetical protein